jgi:resuscitation-promoting factor RpfB
VYFQTGNGKQRGLIILENIYATDEKPMHRMAAFSNRHRRHILQRAIAFILLALLVACTSAPQATEALTTVTIQVDGGQKKVDVPPGTTIQLALEKAAVTLNNLDRVEPPSFTLIVNAVSVKVTRVKEVFDVKETIIPFERQTVRNESLPQGQTMLIQPGVNGVQQITYRQVLEDNIEKSKTVFKTLTITDPRPEIVMVGVQTPFTAVPIPGTLVYLTAGNAWAMQSTTGERRPVVTTGDLDGRVFSVSTNGKWLLFTRKAAADTKGVINTLYVADLSEQTPKPVSLKINNVIHFAAWVPNAGMVVAYSTVEPRDTAPGWQANNDLRFVTLGSIGGVVRDEEIIPPNSGGIYGWWGTDFSYSPDGSQLAYARPDSIGLVNTNDKKLQPLLDIIPLQTRSDWAWVPGINWSPDFGLLYTVSHTPLSGLSADELSPLFDLTAVDTENNQGINLVTQAGMFAYPVPSPDLGGKRFDVAFLQSIFPEQSESSRYKIMLMDRDGSNRKTIFPPEGSPGVDPQEVVWGPVSKENGKLFIGFIYQGNLWLYNYETGAALQITGDGSIGKLDWK